MPPVPPQVAAQQAPPIRQFAQGGPPQPQAGGDPGNGQDSAALMSGLVDTIGKSMTQLATVMGQTKPELVPILKQAVQAMVMISGKLKTADQGAPDGGNQGTGADGAPDAGGGASMGMPQ